MLKCSHRNKTVRTYCLSHRVSYRMDTQISPPYTERYVRWWCAVKVAAEMKEGPSMRFVQANSSNNLNAAVLKSHGSERLGKQLLIK